MDKEQTRCCSFFLEASTKFLIIETPFLRGRPTKKAESFFQKKEKRFVNRVTGCGATGCCGIWVEMVGRDAGGTPSRVIHV